MQETISNLQGNLINNEILRDVTIIMISSIIISYLIYLNTKNKKKLIVDLGKDKWLVGNDKKKSELIKP